MEILLARKGYSTSVSRAAGHLRSALTTHIDKPNIAKKLYKVRYGTRLWHSLPRKIEHRLAIM